MFIWEHGVIRPPENESAISFSPILSSGILFHIGFIIIFVPFVQLVPCKCEWLITCASMRRDFQRTGELSCSQVYTIFYNHGAGEQDSAEEEAAMLKCIFR